MTCEACARAELDPDTPFQHADCKGCAVRALAQGAAFYQSGLDGALSLSYRKALALVLGDDWRAGHEQVKAEHRRIREARAAK